MRSEAGDRKGLAGKLPAFLFLKFDWENMH